MENTLNLAQKYLNVPSVVLSVPVVGTVDVVVLLVLDAAADWVLGLADQPVRDEQRREGVRGEVEPAQVLLSYASQFYARAGITYPLTCSCSGTPPACCPPWCPAA